MKTRALKEFTYLGEKLTVKQNIRTKQPYYSLGRYAATPKTVLEAKKLVISKLAAGKVSVLDIKKVANMVSKIKTKIDLTKIINQTNTQRKGLKAPMPKGMTKSIAKTIAVTGLRKSDGTLKKGYKYQKGGKIVKVKSQIKA